MTFILVAVPYAASTVTRTNLLNNPSGRVSTTGYIATGGVMATAPSGDTYLEATGPVAAWTATILLENMTVGSALKLATNTQYKFSATVYGSPGIDVNLFVGGDGCANVASPSGFGTRVSVTFTTRTSGSVLLFLINTSAMVSGNYIAFSDALLEVGTTLGTYFDGDTPSVGLIAKRYSWKGAANASASVLTARTPLAPLTPGDVLAPYTADRVSTTTLHAIIGREDELPALGPLGLRKGTLDVWCSSLAQADAVVALYAAGNVVMFRDSERPSLDMYHVATSVHVAQADVTARWVVTVVYAEVSGSVGAW